MLVVFFVVILFGIVWVERSILYAAFDWNIWAGFGLCAIIGLALFLIARVVDARSARG